MRARQFSSSSVYSSEVDEESVRQAHANIVAGALQTIALRFAGTADPAAVAVVTHYLYHFRSLRAVGCQ